ncbi:metal ABC transporter permease [Celerinatantimonas diazotrophica]|uniref:Zinc transport system permease protein n=1 Tax=Celerinatantimonas diazotrophica TaxID=412034 RepID=A0A4R1K1P9_9GAMM|nr:metal ABC transporter permease [Celerinatantimonas diazotrophica]TCK57905.1 zinc transport system permease protein [Celerinatantimonas diazotrophica]CAG9298027.1 Manganese transport system membrane protein MntB [Celerinatantimonas diazotrophica]
MHEFFSFTFIQHALMAAVLASIACGVVGTLIVINQLVFLAGGVAHAAYGGVGAAITLRLPMLPTLLCFTSSTALLMGALTVKRRERTEVLIGAMWAVGMAIGILLLDFSNGYNVDLMSYLFGSMLAVSSFDLWVMGSAVALIVVLATIFYEELLMISFDMEYARTKRVPVWLIYTLLLLMTACATVVLIRVVGIILTIALLTIPSFIGMRYADRLWKMMIVAAFSSFVFCVGGLVGAYFIDVTASAAIIVLATLTLGIILLFEKLSEYWQRHKLSNELKRD